ncbi:MAG TPA: cryptochrome/photolyase family protein, partial [Chitinophagaceae bacterium]|nr:cryptochrome/photolyase family protein [Chitinophagaceae bacterium]
RFHKQKLVLHRATMKMYQSFLEKKGIRVHYVEAKEKLSDTRQLMPFLTKKNYKQIHVARVADNWLAKRILQSAAKAGIKVITYPTPNFLNTPEETETFFENKKTYFQTDFYIYQRKKRILLLDKHNKPQGGKWSFDDENRLRLPKTEKIPAVPFPAENIFVKEAKKYVETHFPRNYGITNEFNYPVTYTDAEKWLDDFLKTRFAKFGPYEDAMVKEEHFLYHSVLTPMLNIGLLNPQQIIDKALEAATTYQVPLNSLEGLIRQITGWREFIQIVYDREGSRQRTTNYWGFNRKIPPTFWVGNTGIHPVDIVIKKIVKTGYSHHIERLMVLGNFMLLCEFSPDEVYQWFMEMYIDSYDWVMVPNVYGMTQFADGGLMTTKPYISGSNYLMKMGDWEKGSWQEIWDGLFWRFMHVHRSFFMKNPRMGMLVKTFDKMPEAKRNAHLQNAETFLNNLDQ